MAETQQLETVTTYRKSETEQRIENLERIVKILAGMLGVSEESIDRALLDGLP